MNEKAKRFATDFLNDLENGTIKKECMTNHFADFSEGLELLYKERHCAYFVSCGCLMMDIRLKKKEEKYHG
jgi:hypothetical protein